MPTFNFKKNKPKSSPVEESSTDKANTAVNTIKAADNTDTIKDVNDTNYCDLSYEYNILSNCIVDKTKTYYSAFFKSLILFTDYNACCYNILNKVDNKNDIVHYYVCLYKEKQENAIKLTRDYTGGYKIYIYNILPNLNKDINVNVQLVDKKDNPDCGGR